MMATTVESWVDGGSHSAAPPSHRDWHDLYELAKVVYNVDGFVPKAIQGKPAAVLATLLAGDELGFSPMESLRAIFIIDGRVGLYAEAARALIYEAGHELRVDADDTQATARGRRRDWPDSADYVSVQWTIDRAKRAGLAGRQQWARYPRQMLQARASSELGRLLFPDVLAGLDVYEELADDAVEPPKTTRKRASIGRPATTPPSLETAVEAPYIDAGTTPAQPPPGPPLPPLPGEEEDPGGGPTRYASSAAPGPTGESSAPPPSPPPEPDPEVDAMLAEVREMRDHLPPSREPRPEPLSRDEPEDRHGRVLRRLHARMSETFPDANRDDMDAIRHALVVAVTRGRPSGPVQSSALLTDAEVMGFDARLNDVQAGLMAVHRVEALVVELRQAGWLYRVHLSLDPDAHPPEWESIKEAPR